MATDNFNDILREIKNTKDKLVFYSPSSDSENSILPLTLKQQKLIIENSLTSTLSLLFFNNCMFDIIKENYLGDVKKLDTLDRVNISLVLRQKMSDKFKDEEENIETTLTEILEKNKKKIDLEPEAIETEKFTFYVKKPNLLIDNKINNIILRKYKGKEITESNVSKVISDVYIYELIKFIVKLQFNENEIDIHENLDNSFKLLNEIASDNFTKIYQYINKLRDLENDLTLIPGTKTNISITPDFFIVQ
jgi:hypothetical protein